MSTLFEQLDKKADDGELLSRVDLLNAAEEAGMPRALSDEILDAILFQRSELRGSTTALRLFRGVVDAYALYHPKTL